MNKSCPVFALAALLAGTSILAQDATTDKLQTAKASPEHEFLKRFVGEWDCDGEGYIEPGKPPIRIRSTMKGYMIGDFWAVIDVRPSRHRGDREVRERALEVRHVPLHHRGRFCVGQGPAE